MTNVLGTDTASLHAMADQIGQANGLPPGLLPALVNQESGFNIEARSPVGALGLGQLMPQTAAGLGVIDPFNPTQNLTGSAQYLRDQLNRFGSVPLALAAYNAGPAAVAKYGGIPPYQETQNYVHTIMSAMQAQPKPLPPPLGSLGSSPRPGGILPPAEQPRKNIGAILHAIDTDNIQGLLGALRQPKIHPAASFPGLWAPHPDAPETAQAVPGVRGAVISSAAKYLNVPYIYGGNDPKNGIDCSRFVQLVLSDNGIQVGRTTTAQYQQGQAVPLHAMQAGDVVFTEPGQGPSGGPGHEGLYIGNGKVQESPHTGDKNKIVDLSGFLKGGLVGIRRYVQPKGAM